MGSRFINGATFAISTAVAAAVPITALSNAAPAVATTASPPTTGDVVVVNSGWPALNDLAYAVGVTAATTFELADTDTTSVAEYPAGEGVGAFTAFSSYVGLSQVRDVQQEGGDPNFFTFQYVEDKSGRQRQKPTFKSAETLMLTLDYDPALPWYATLESLDRNRDQPILLRETLPGGDRVYHYGFVSFKRNPTRSLNENMTVTLTISLINSVLVEAV